MKDFHQKLFRKACKAVGIEIKLKMYPRPIIGNNTCNAAVIYRKGSEFELAIPAYPDTLDGWVEVMNEYLRIIDNIKKDVYPGREEMRDILNNEENYHGRKSETPTNTAAASAAAAAANI